jgi:DNA-directed RNA polymerase subunit RPC12/RpoP
MRLRFACRACEATVATSATVPPVEVACPECGARISFAAPPGGPGAPIERCLTCGGPHLFLQKEFPRRLGLAIAILGAVLFLVLMSLERIYLGFGALLGVALVDALVYRTAKMMTVCYHCQTEYRSHPVNPHHGGYDPKIAFYTAKKALLDLSSEGRSARGR